MEKQQILSLIEAQLQAGTITPSDLQVFTGSAPAPSVPAQPAAAPVNFQKNLINVFYAIGGIIVLTGICILVGQHWEDIGFIGRVGVSLGLATVLYIAAILARAQRILSQVCFTIAAALAPLGAYVVLTENAINFGSVEQMITALALCALFVGAWFITRHAMPFLLAVFFATWAFYCGVVKMVETAGIIQGDVFAWATIVAGAAYLLVAAWFRNATEGEATREAGSVRGILYTLGSLMALGAGFSLEGMWDLFYIPFLFAFFYLSVFLKTRGMLLFAGIFLIAHLVYLTSRYFVDSIGWPIALVICGFIVIGIGYGTFYVMRKYMK